MPCELSMQVEIWVSGCCRCLIYRRQSCVIEWWSVTAPLCGQGNVNCGLVLGRIDSSQVQWHCPVSWRDFIYNTRRNYVMLRQICLPELWSDAACNKFDRIAEHKTCLSSSGRCLPNPPIDRYWRPSASCRWNTQHMQKWGACETVRCSTFDTVDAFQWYRFQCTLNLSQNY